MLVGPAAEGGEAGAEVGEGREAALVARADREGEGDGLGSSAGGESRGGVDAAAAVREPVGQEQPAAVLGE